MRSMTSGTMIATTILLLGCQNAPQTEDSAMARAETAQGTAETTATPSSMGVVARTNLIDYAVGVLELAAGDDHPQLRANAIEGLQPRPSIVRAYVRSGLVDENRGVRFAAAMTIGRLKLKELAPLAEPLLLDESKSVQAAAMFALHECDNRVDLNPLASMIRSNDPEVRANAALVLGELKESSAAPMIEQSLGRGLELTSPSKARIVDLQLAEALVKLGRSQQIQSIRAALFLPPDFQEITALAAAILGRLNDEGSAASLQRLIEAEGDQRRPAEVRMAAAMSLAQLGFPAPVQVPLEYLNNERLQLRYQAAITLGWMPSKEAIPALQRLIEDPNPLVQVAAAASILQLEQRGDGP